MKITCVRCKVGQKAEVIELEDSLESYQSEVGGYIELFPLREDVVIVCNEEGKLWGLEPNGAITFHHKTLEIINGDFLICKTAGEDFADMPQWEAFRWASTFHHPQCTVEVANDR